MSLFTDPQTHDANPPESWTIERIQSGSRVYWALHIDPEAQHPAQSYGTKREAQAATTEGFYFDLWHQERRWYAGESVRNWKPYAEVVAEREKAAAKKRRKAEKMGTSPEVFESWREVVSDRNAIEKRPGAVDDVAAEMFDLLNDGAGLIAPASLNREEAAALYQELAESWGFASDVYTELHRVKYLGIGADRSAVEVLEELERIERESMAAWLA